MTNKEKELFAALEDARARFHGLSSAMSLHLEDPYNYPLNKKNFAKMLQDSNVKASNILSKFHDLYEDWRDH